MTDEAGTPHDGASGGRGSGDADQAGGVLRGPIQGLDDLAEFFEEHPIDSRSFLRGLTVGIFVGAAIAGSAVWRRWRRRPAAAAPPEPAIEGRTGDAAPEPPAD